MDAVSILGQIELFRGLNSDQLARLGALARRDVYGMDSVIFHQGDRGDRVYVIAQGQVEIRFDRAGGGTHAALYLGVGQLVGELALLDQGTRSATVVAIEPNTVVYSMDCAELLALCATDTAIGFLVMRNLAVDLSFKLRHRSLDPLNSL